MLASKAKVMGHPAHPMLIVFPFGLLGMSAVFDVAALVTGHGLFATVAFWMIVSGVVSGVVAAAFGIADFFGIPRDDISLDGMNPPGGIAPGVPATSSARLKLLGPPGRAVAGEFNGERIVGRAWPIAENRIVFLELHY